MYQTIVVGTDGSDRASRAVAWAADFAVACDATLHVIHAIQGTREQVVRAGRAVVEQVSAELEGHGVRLRTHLIQGHAADAILDFAYDAGAGLIIVGNRGMAGKGRFLGSVPNAIAHDARCAVMIVPTDET
ncbi:MAG: universal stress protein [Acidimicrobiia bacterium]|nr:universal stress protein [Acidimicrobiia bacterium]